MTKIETIYSSRIDEIMDESEIRGFARQITLEEHPNYDIEPLICDDCGTYHFGGCKD